MPTIDDLPAAASVGDDDVVMVMQSGVTRKAIRSQLISGLQPNIFLPENSLVGRISRGIGSPEIISIGANLELAGNIISAPAPFSIASVSEANAVQAADLVPIGQGGENTSLPYAAFMSGISNIAGIDVSALNVSPRGVAAGRSLADIATDAIAIEAFGAAGDGVTDDTTAFTAAIASEQPVRLDAKTYIVNGPVVISNSTALLGVAGRTIIRRLVLTDSADWIFVTAPSIRVSGIEFDAGSLAGSDSSAVNITSSCFSSHFFQCTFCNAVGAVYGSGISIQCATSSVHHLMSCSMTGNVLHGVAASGLGNVNIADSDARNNGNCGLSFTNGVATTAARNFCAFNQYGISLGGWNDIPFSASSAAPVIIQDNICISNAVWGIAAAGTGAIISGNTVSNDGSMSVGGCILARLIGSQLSSNIITGGASGIDCRCSTSSNISSNSISRTTSALLVGGSQNVYIKGNYLYDNTWGIIVSGIEPTLSNIPSSAVTIDGNWIGLSLSQGAALSVSDGAQGVCVINNSLNGWGSASIDQALWLHTDAAIVRGNTWNNTTRSPLSSAIVADRPTLVIPDVADDAFIISAPPDILSVITSHQAVMLGKIAFIRVVSGGSGYSQATVSITGSGAGAQAQAILQNGSVIWVTVTNPGSGYGDIGSSVTIAINGDGSGATVQGYVGLPVIEGRKIRLACNTPIRLVQSGSVPTQTSWTGFDTSVPAMGAVEIEGTYGQWRAVLCPPVDYVAPTGDGGVVLQSVAGADLTLRPSSGGTLQIASADEPTGYSMSVGRGSPQGVVTASPGSDYRNLNGGSGNTLWVKQVGTDSQGWVAIA